MGTWQKVAAENIVRHSSSGTYYLNAKIAGRKIRRSLETTDLRIAKIKRDTTLSGLRSAAAPSAGLKTVGDALSIVEVRVAEAPHLRPKSREYYIEIFRLLRESLPVARGAAAWTAADVSSWWSAFAKTRAATQANNALRMVRKIAETIRQAGLRFDDPTSDLHRMRGKKSAVETLVSRDDFEAILADIRSQRRRNDNVALMIEFFAWSGLRKSEAAALQWQDVGPDWLRVTGGEQGTKGGDSRMVPINPKLRAVIDRMPGERSGPVFLLKSPREALRLSCERLGIRHVRVHDLRHLFATVCIESGIDIPTVAKWLGHKDGGVLAMRTYGHLRDEHSLAAARKVG